jgi:hypothetical protein
MIKGLINSLKRSKHLMDCIVDELHFLYFELSALSFELYHLRLCGEKNKRGRS